MSCNSSASSYSTVSFPFGGISWVVWIVFMILYYGTGTIADWPVFWIWFPFWLPFALLGAVLVIIVLYALVLALLEHWHE